MVEYNYVILENNEEHYELNDPEKWKSVVTILCEENGSNLDDFLQYKYENHRRIEKYHKKNLEDPKLVFDGPLDLLERAERMTEIFKKWLHISE